MKSVWPFTFMVLGPAVGLLVVAPASWAAAETLVDAPIVEVTVFGDRARVVRSVRRDPWPRGRLALPTLPATTDLDSVRLEAKGARLDWATVRRLGAEEISGPAAAAALARLDDVAARLARRRSEVEQIERTLAALLGRPADGGGGGGDDDEAGAGAVAGPAGRLAPAQWRRALDLLDREGGRYGERLRLVRREIAALEREEQEVKESSKGLLREGGVLVTTVLPARPPAELRLTYEVRGARWRPAWEVRLDPGRERVSATLWAEVEQETGEAWEDVALVVSAAAPQAPALPDLPAWRIGERELFVPTTLAIHPARVPGPPPLPAEGPPPPNARLREALMGRLARPNVTESFDVAPAQSLPPDSGRAAVAAAPTPEAEPPSRPNGGAAPGATPALAVHGPGAATPPEGGVIRGYVFDPAGNPLRGVKVRLIGGPVAYSNEEGTFVLRPGRPGLQELWATAPKLKTLVLRGITVTAGNVAEVNLIMEVEDGGVEEVRVVEKAPVVSTNAVAEHHYGEMGSLAHAPPPESQGPAAPTALVSLAPPLPAPIEPAAGPLTDATQGLALAFTAPARASVPSRPGVRRVPLAEHRFTARTERHLYPAVAGAAFVSARLQGPAVGFLPGGPARLFVGADPAGVATLGLVRPGAAFTLPLGRDESLRAVRRLTQQTRSTGLLAREEATRYQVTVEVSNPHPFPVPLQIHDQLPVSPDRSVQVALGEAAPRPQHDARSGALTFALTLPPGATRSVRFSYTLTRPRGHRLTQVQEARP